MNWSDICLLKDSKTHMVPLTWTLDKYPDAPTLGPRSRVTFFDREGPGVVTMIHVSDYVGLPGGNRADAAPLIIRVWYDREEAPSIEMPFMDFLGDIEAAAMPYHTVHLSRVRASHNFRLPLPFRRHLKIEVENPGVKTVFGYTDIQWDELDALPAGCGRLRAAYRSGTFRFPHEELTLFDLHTRGSIAAHWLQLEGDHPACAAGEGICEGNHEIYLDGDREPTCESLGAEDFYGHSWGFKGIETDHYSAIIRHERTPAGGTRVAMIRARSTDAISFRQSCRMLFTYRHDLGEPFDPKTGMGKAPSLSPFVDGAELDVPFRSCVYYYTD